MSALLSTAALCLGIDPSALADEIGAGGSSALKDVAVTAVNEHLAPLRERRRTLAQDGDLVRKVLSSGNEHASVVAEETLTEVRTAMGTTY